MAFIEVKERPDVPAEQQAVIDWPVRYQDVIEDGRIRLLSIPHAAGDVIWRRLVLPNPTTLALYGSGIVPILTRITIVGGSGPFGVHQPMKADGAFRFARAEDRMLMEFWVSLSGPADRTYPPSPPNAGETIEGGAVFAQHVLTRPFAPAEQRRVVGSDLGSTVKAFGAASEWVGTAELLDAPADAKWLGGDVLDEQSIAFGLDDTDSNQHVTSLRYPELFVEAVLRRIAAAGSSCVLAARAVDVAYRKPCFAGDQVGIRLRVFETEDGFGAVGSFVPRDLPDAKPHCTLRLLLGP
jgi:hypothetical protein